MGGTFIGGIKYINIDLTAKIKLCTPNIQLTTCFRNLDILKIPKNSIIVGFSNFVIDFSNI